MNKKMLPYLLGGLLVGVIITLAVVMIWFKRDVDVAKENSGALLPAITGTSSVPSEPVADTPLVAPAVPVKKLSYSDALKRYTGFRFQFVNCRAQPYLMSLRKDGTFLLDNRDTVAHTISVGSQKYTLGAYGFAIATATPVGTDRVLCDGHWTATLNVEL